MQQSAGLGRIQTHGHKYSRMENQLKVLEITSSVVHFFISVVILEPVTGISCDSTREGQYGK